MFAPLGILAVLTLGVVTSAVLRRLRQPSTVEDSPTSVEWFRNPRYDDLGAVSSDWVAAQRRKRDN